MHKQSMFISAAIIMALSLTMTSPAGATESDPPEGITLPDHENLTQGITNPSGMGDPAKPWTAERMRNAIPADLIDSSVVLNATEPESGPSKEAKKNKEAKKKGVVVADPVGAQTANQVTPLAVGPSTAPSTAGKFFYYSPFDGKDHSCSGSTINSAYKNLVMTAGHCVHGGQGSGYYTDFAYSPGYFNGPNLSYGVWTWESARTLTAWANNSDTSRDQAFVAFAPRGAQELVNVVGANGLVIGNSTAQSNTRIFGWPAEAPYDGERPYYCDGDTSAYAFSSTDAALYCDMTGGASGGPWLKDRINQDTGYVFAVTSRRTLIGRPLLLATPNTSAVQSMYNLMT